MKSGSRRGKRDAERKQNRKLDAIHGEKGKKVKGMNPCNSPHASS
jgi:hypothetical protein